MSAGPIVNAIEQRLQVLQEALLDALRTDTRRVASQTLAEECQQLQHLCGWLPPSHPYRTGLGTVGKVLPALLQARADATVTTRLLGHCLQVLRALPVTVSTQLCHWALQALQRAELAWRRGATDANALHTCRQLGHWLQGGRALDEPAPRAEVQWEQLQRWRQHWHEQLHGNAQQQAQRLLDAELDALPQAWRAARGGDQQALQGLVKRVRHVLTLLKFTTEPARLAAFSDHIQPLLAAVPEVGGAQGEGVQQAWQRWFAWRWQLRRASPMAAMALPWQVAQAGSQDVGEYHAVLKAWLAAGDGVQALPLNAELLRWHYLLPWLLEALQQPALATLYHGWYRSLLLHWHYRLPVPAGLQALLQRCERWLLPAVEADAAAGAVLAAQLQLLECWPVGSWSPATGAQLPAEAATQLVALANIPALLAGGLTTLSALAAAWFNDAAALAPHLQALLDELRFLERGAAAVKVYAVESWCTQLLCFHLRLAAWPATQPYPGELLWQAHAHLLALLDEAAAWLEPRFDAELAARVQQWLANAECVLSLQSQQDHRAAFEARALQQLRRLADPLEQVVRFSAPELLQMGERCEAMLLDALRVLWRHLLLGHAQAREQRRLTHRPAVLAMTLSCTRTGDHWYCRLHEDGGAPTPEAAVLQRLARKLPKNCGQLQVETGAAHDRTFTFVMQDA